MRKALDNATSTDFGNEQLISRFYDDDIYSVALKKSNDDIINNNECRSSIDIHDNVLVCVSDDTVYKISTLDYVLYDVDKSKCRSSTKIDDSISYNVTFDFVSVPDDGKKKCKMEEEQKNKNVETVSLLNDSSKNSFDNFNENNELELAEAVGIGVNNAPYKIDKIENTNDAPCKFEITCNPVGILVSAVGHDVLKAVELSEMIDNNSSQNNNLSQNNNEEIEGNIMCNLVLSQKNELEILKIADDISGLLSEDKDATISLLDDKTEIKIDDKSKFKCIKLNNNMNIKKVGDKKLCDAECGISMNCISSTNMLCNKSLKNKIDNEQYDEETNQYERLDVAEISDTVFRSANDELELDRSILNGSLNASLSGNKLLRKTLGRKSNASLNASSSIYNKLLSFAYNIYINNIIILNTYIKIIYIQYMINYIIIYALIYYVLTQWCINMKINYKALNVNKKLKYKNGDKIFMGRPAQLAISIEGEETPIAKEIKGFVFKGSLITFVLGNIFFIIGMVENGNLVANVIFLISGIFIIGCDNAINASLNNSRNNRISNALLNKITKVYVNKLYENNAHLFLSHGLDNDVIKKAEVDELGNGIDTLGSSSKIHGHSDELLEDIFNGNGSNKYNDNYNNDIIYDIISVKNYDDNKCLMDRTLNENDINGNIIRIYHTLNGQGDMVKLMLNDKEQSIVNENKIIMHHKINTKLMDINSDMKSNHSACINKSNHSVCITTETPTLSYTNTSIPVYTTIETPTLSHTNKETPTLSYTKTINIKDINDNNKLEYRQQNHIIEIAICNNIIDLIKVNYDNNNNKCVTIISICGIIIVKFVTDVLENEMKQQTEQKLNNKNAMIQMKSAPERILELCDRYLYNDEIKDLNDEIRTTILGSRAERVLALTELILDNNIYDINIMGLDRRYRLADNCADRNNIPAMYDKCFIEIDNMNIIDGMQINESLCIDYITSIDECYEELYEHFTSLIKSSSAKEQVGELSYNGNVDQEQLSQIIQCKTTSDRRNGLLLIAVPLTTNEFKMSNDKYNSNIRYLNLMYDKLENKLDLLNDDETHIHNDCSNLRCNELLIFTNNKIINLWYYLNSLCVTSAMALFGDEYVLVNVLHKICTSLPMLDDFDIIQGIIESLAQQPNSIKKETINVADIKLINNEYKYDEEQYNSDYYYVNKSMNNLFTNEIIGKRAKYILIELLNTKSSKLTFENTENINYVSNYNGIQQILNIINKSSVENGIDKLNNNRSNREVDALIDICDIQSCEDIGFVNKFNASNPIFGIIFIDENNNDNNNIKLFAKSIECIIKKYIERLLVIARLNELEEPFKESLLDEECNNLLSMVQYLSSGLCKITESMDRNDIEYDMYEINELKNIFEHDVQYVLNESTLEKNVLNESTLEKTNNITTNIVDISITDNNKMNKINTMPYHINQIKRIYNIFINDDINYKYIFNNLIELENLRVIHNQLVETVNELKLVQINNGCDFYLTALQDINIINKFWDKDNEINTESHENIKIVDLREGDLNKLIDAMAKLNKFVRKFDIIFRKHELRSSCETLFGLSMITICRLEAEICSECIINNVELILEEKVNVSNILSQLDYYNTCTETESDYKDIQTEDYSLERNLLYEYSTMNHGDKFGYITTYAYEPEEYYKLALSLRPDGPSIYYNLALNQNNNIYRIGSFSEDECDGDTINLNDIANDTNDDNNINNTTEYYQLNKILTQLKILSQTNKTFVVGMIAVSILLGCNTINFGIVITLSSILCIITLMNIFYYSLYTKELCVLYESGAVFLPQHIRLTITSKQSDFIYDEVLNFVNPRTDERLNRIENFVQHINLHNTSHYGGNNNNNKLLNINMDFETEEESLNTAAIVLKMPNIIIYSERGPMKAQPVDDFKYFQTRNWGIVYEHPRYESFYSAYEQYIKKRHFDRYNCPIALPTPRPIMECDLYNCNVNNIYNNNIINKNDELLVLILPDGMRGIKAKFTKLMQSESLCNKNILIQCIQSQTCRKLNACLGTFEDIMITYGNIPYMIDPVLPYNNIDVSHVIDKPSVACLSNSRKSFEGSCRKEIIAFTNMIRLAYRVLEQCYNATINESVQHLPISIFVFRDGVADGQIEQLFTKEVIGIQRAITMLRNKYKLKKWKPKLQYILCNKNTIDRFGLLDKKTGLCRSLNKPYVIYDHVLSDRLWDFIIFPYHYKKYADRTKVVRYIVLFDDSTLSKKCGAALDLFQFIFSLPYMFAFSIPFPLDGTAQPAPIVYAKHYAESFSQSILSNDKELASLKINKILYL